MTILRHSRNLFCEQHRGLNSAGPSVERLKGDDSCRQRKKRTRTSAMEDSSRSIEWDADTAKHIQLLHLMSPSSAKCNSLASRSILVSKLLVFPIRQVRKLDIPRVFHRRSITGLVLPAVVHQQKYGRADRYRVYDDDGQLRWDVSRSILIAECQWSEDVALELYSQYIARRRVVSSISLPSRNSSGVWRSWLLSSCGRPGSPLRKSRRKGEMI